MSFITVTGRITATDGATEDGVGAGAGRKNRRRAPARPGGLPASNQSFAKTQHQTKRPPPGRSSCHWRSRLVANHDAAAVDTTDPMLTSATARSSSFYHHGARNDDDFPAVGTAAAFRSAMKTSTAATFHLDDHAVRTLAGRQRRGLRGASRYSQNESKCYNSVHSF